MENTEKMKKEVELSQHFAKKTMKDSVFRELFKNPKYLLQLYQSLHPEDTSVTLDEIGSVTIKNVFII